MGKTQKAESVSFTTKGQVVIPARFRQEYEIVKGTRALIVAQPEGILLKPITPAVTQRLRGALKRKAGRKPLVEEWTAHKAEERDLEERKHARSTDSR